MTLKAVKAYYHSFAIDTKLLSLKTDSWLIPTTTSVFRTTYINLFTNNHKQQHIVTSRNKRTHKQK